MSLAADVNIRRATGDDSAALCRLFSDVTMDADVVVSIQRSPDFFGLYRLQSDDYECWVGERAGQVEGVASVLVRPGYINGRVEPVGYLGDLRARSKSRVTPALARRYGPIISDVAGRSGASVFLTAIISSNEKALRVLTGNRASEHGLPTYWPLQRFSIRSLHATVPRFPRRSALKVRQAQPSDIQELERFLDADARRRPYGYVFADGGLQRRLNTWPGLDVSDFCVAEDKSGAWVGVMALWDCDAVKRTVVQAYRNRMAWIHRAYNLGAAALRYEPLPPPGSPLPYAYVTHLAIPDDDPAVMAALLDFTYPALRRSGNCMMSACVYEDDPLTPAYKGYLTTDLPAQLFAVTPPGAPSPGDYLLSGRPGFEMALV